MIQFTSSGRFMNPSRIDPTMIGRNTANYLVLPGTYQGYITFTTALFVTDSCLQTTRDLFNNEPRKLISGIPHAVEAPRMIAALNMAMRIPNANVQMRNDSITFMSGRGSGGGGSGSASN